MSAVCLRNERRTGIDEVQQPETKPPCAPIKLSVVCGHLAFARYPVLVGHYSGDTQVLEGRLTARRQMGLYPGPIGSSVIVLDSSARPPPGAAVVGLGEPAELSVGALRRTLRRGLLALGATRIDRVTFAEEGVEAESALCVSTVLIGAGEGGLDRSGCVQALLQAAAEAQEILARVSKAKALLRVALAAAWGELGDLPKAIEHYTAAVRSSDASFKVKAIEQLANLSARNAVVTLRVLPPRNATPPRPWTRSRRGCARSRG